MNPLANMPSGPLQGMDEPSPGGQGKEEMVNLSIPKAQFEPFLNVIKTIVEQFETPEDEAAESPEEQEKEAEEGTELHPAGSEEAGMADEEGELELPKTGKKPLGKDAAKEKEIADLTDEMEGMSKRRG
jgi:hypothetical protein